jgi:hypothetical protein
LRTKDLSEGERLSWTAHVEEVLKPLGFDVVLETNPPHLHIEVARFISRI